MKLQKSLTPQQISDYTKVNEIAAENGHRLRIQLHDEDEFIRPTPPTERAVKAAQFVDKTYTWNGR